MPRSPAHESLYDRNFWLAVVSQTCFVIANTLMAHYARWIEFLGGNLRQVGWIMGGGAVLSIALRPWLGQWIGTAGSRATWCAGCVLFAFCSVGNLLLVDLSWSIFLLRSGLLLAAAIVFASSLTYIAQTAPEIRRTEAIGILGTGGFLGMLIGPFLGDLLLGASDRSRSDYSILFVVAAVANLAALVLVTRLRRPSGEIKVLGADPTRFVATIRRHWPGMILLVDLMFGVCMAGPFVFVASFIDREPLRIDAVSMLGLFFWCYAGMGLTVRIGFRRLPDRIGAHKVLLAGMVFMSLGMLMFLVVDESHPWRIVLPGLLAGTGHGLMFHTMMSLTIESFPRQVRGIGSALALMMLDLGTIAGAPVLGVIGDLYGFRVLFAAIGLTCVLTSLAYAVSLSPIFARPQTKAA